MTIAEKLNQTYPAKQKVNGQTWYQWAREMFSYENCAECGKGVRGHLPAMVLGNWFAFCKQDYVKY